MSKTINMSYAWMDFLLLIILGALVAISHHLAAAATTKLVLLAELIKMGVLVCVILIPYGQRTLISVNVICLAISAVNFLFAVRIANKVKSV